MWPLNYSSKRAFECEVPLSPKFGQGISQPCNVSPHPHPNQNNAKRQKPSQSQVLRHLNLCKGSFNASGVHNQPQQASLSVNADPCLTYSGGSRPCGMNAPLPITDNWPDSLRLQRSVKSFASNGSHISSDPFWKEATPTSESYTLASSSSTGERAEWGFDPGPPLDDYLQPHVSVKCTEEDISYATGNSGHGGNFGFENSLYEGPDIPSSSPMSTKDYSNAGPNPTHNLDSYVESQNMNWTPEITITNPLGYDPSYYEHNICKEQQSTYALPVVPQIFPWQSDFEFHEQRIHTPRNCEEVTSAPGAPPMTLWQPVFRRRIVNFDIGDVTRLDFPNSLQEYVPISASKTSDELSSLSHFSNSATQGSVSRGQSRGRSEPVIQDAILFPEFEGQTPTLPIRAVASNEIPGQNMPTFRGYGNPSVPESLVAVTPTTKRRRGGRKGPLKLDNAKKAKETRKKGACFQCRAHKVTCSGKDEMCDRCENTRWSLTPNLCTRAHLSEYCKMFFPDFLVCHLQKTAVNELLEKTIISPSTPNFDITISCGQRFKSMRLKVAEFTPAKDKLIKVPLIISRDGKHVFEDQSPAPVALQDIDLGYLMRNCKTHARNMARTMYGSCIAATEGIGSITSRLLQAIDRYHTTASEDRKKLLEKAMMLHSMHYFMGRTITYSDDSSATITQKLKRPSLGLWNSNVVSNLLNRQVKFAMHSLRVETTNEILKELETQLRTRDKGFWATAFSIIIILCMCMEEAQMAMNGIVMHKRTHQNEALSPEIMVEKCRKLDEYPFRHVTELFHATFKTRKYNPIRDGFQAGEDTTPSHDLETFVNAMRSIMHHYGDVLEERAKAPSFSGGHESLNQHMMFRETNSARLVANFLISFEAYET